MRNAILYIIMYSVALFLVIKLLGMNDPDDQDEQ